MNLGVRASRAAATILTWVGLVAGALPVFALLARAVGKGAVPAIALVRGHAQTLWLVMLSAFTGALLIWVGSLQRRLATRFKDDFTKPLALKWDYRGGWYVGEDKTLTVTGSPDGGLTKLGALWENYSFKFDANILRTCLGVVVRARSLDDYYMLQITADQIRPHRRVALPVQGGAAPARPDSSVGMRLVPVPYVVVWQVMEDLVVPLPTRPASWFSVEVTVRGEAVQMRINDEIVFDQASWLQNATGKVGFRNDANELAMVRRVRVQALA